MNGCSNSTHATTANIFRVVGFVIVPAAVAAAIDLVVEIVQVVYDNILANSSMAVYLNGYSILLQRTF